MSATSYVDDREASSASSGFVTELAWFIVLLPPILFAWHESHFQYDVYVPADYGAFFNALSIAGVLIIAAASWPKSYPRTFVRMVVGYIALAALHSVLDQVITSDRKLIFFVKAIGFALIMLPIVSDKRMLHRFVRVNFVLGMMLIALSTVPVLHWLNIISLPFRQVRRVGSEEGFFDLDPLHFGLFGLTENYVPPGHPINVARLQGYSLEPIHWAYFVFLTIACGLFLLPARPSARQRLGFWLLGLLIAVHLFFVFSAVAFIALTVWIGTLAVMLIVRRRSGRFLKRETLLGMIVLILMPGIMIPFFISRIPNLDLLLVSENVLNKGSNWESKIGFLSLGSALYKRFLPSVGDPPSAGQNLLLSTYLKYGYFLSLPLLAYLWVVLKRAFAGTRFTILGGTAIAIVAHTIVVPPLLFYPTGAMMTLLAVGVAYHAGSGRVPNPVES